LTKWNNLTIGDLCDYGNGNVQTGPFGSQLHKSDYTDNGFPVIMPVNIINGVISTEGIARVSGEKYAALSKHHLKKGDIVYARRGDIGRLAIITENEEGWLCGTGCLRIRLNNPNINSAYLYYYLSQESVINVVRSMAVGTTMPNLNTSILRGIPVEYPELSLQNKVVSILSLLDRKITLNREINETLEELSMSLYKYWFVDFGPFQDGEFVETESGLIPKGWEFRTIKEITAKFCTGLNPRKNFILGEGTNYYVTIKNISNNQVILNEKCDKITDEAIKKINKRSDLRRGDLLFSGIGTIGRVHYIDEEPKNWNISESIFTLRNNDAVSDLFLYLTLLSPELQSYAYYSASGSVQKGVRKKDLESYKVLVPEEKVMNHFTNKISGLLEQIKTNEKENKQLVNIRDYLIPKLLSGEINLSKVEEKENVLQ
jgi:type I restriction enzyme, S subunit